MGKNWKKQQAIDFEPQELRKYHFSFKNEYQPFGMEKDTVKIK